MRGEEPITFYFCSKQLYSRLVMLGDSGDLSERSRYRGKYNVQGDDDGCNSVDPAEARETYAESEIGQG
jgi:hypothetical protein